MIRPHTLLTAVIATAAMALSAPRGTAAGKPNIVYILTDQWRASATGYAGDPNVKTPHLDTLAKQSLELTHAVSVLPVCTPYRAALMTGRYPTSTGMFLNDLYLPSEELCMAEIFSAAGYTTGNIGKWHLDGHGRSAFIPAERRQGWQYWKVAECDHTYSHSHYYTGDSPVKQFWPGFDSIAQTKDAQEYLRAHAKSDQPFILMLAFGGPHFPYNDAPKEFTDLYPPDRIQIPPNVPEKMARAARNNGQGYYALCTLIDQCVGDLLKTLDETGLAKNTIVVFTSDHGETLGSHGMSPNNKQVCWDEASAVPLLIRIPDVSPRKVTTPITTPDILPTLLGLSGLEIPKSIEGEDLSASLLHGTDLDRAALFMGVSPFCSPPNELRRPYRAIRTTRYTYVRDLDGPWLLYDDEKDPHQLNNLIGTADAAALTETLDQRLKAELKRIGDEFHPAEWYCQQWGLPYVPHRSVPYSDQSDVVYSPKKRASE